ncbi:glycerophosphodiester phosphodiesterase [Glutamicibacter protophormiae]|uniref:glycerophosphodiester phosphodiesterase n=1 Tax=Glutamicibacter protophormiae TaxID=37930 RepID=UPI00195E8ECF|nr:glycerophosphodiester phosphodiesterase family protein [Glutamicibacter protophormiae]QRQ79995.1 hypothetical protein JQN66_07260 [Glutamicibacter protophormiae]
MENRKVEALNYTRRAFLGLVGTVVLAGCSPAAPLFRNTDQAKTVQDFVNEESFVIAHRGSGDTWTEHTLAAYQNSVEAGARAIEISVHRTLDGVFICHHDANLRRMTGVDKNIADLTYAELDMIRNDAREWLGPRAGTEPIPRLQDVLDRIPRNVFLFIEDKTGQNTSSLLDLMDSVEAATSRMVWKQNCTAEGYVLAHERGYLTWGYFAPEAFELIPQLQERFDLLGIHDSASDGQLSLVASFGKPVICWEIHTLWQRERTLNAGIAGLMASGYPYISRSSRDVSISTDTFRSGLRSPGDLPDALTWTAQPELRMADGALCFSGIRKSSYVLGSLSPLIEGTKAVRFQLRWPEATNEKRIAGFAFGLLDDRPYRAFEASQKQGIHLQIESTGDVSLWKASDEAPLKLNSIHIGQIDASEWLQVDLQMSGDFLEISFPSKGRNMKLTAPVSLHGFISLLALINAGLPVEFKNVQIES